MKTRDLKSLSETIASVVDPIDKERAQMLQEGFLNSLTEKARQVYSSINEEKDEDEKEESPAEEKAEDKAEMLMKKLAAKALKRAKKKAATNEEVELAEKAAPGYEDWASDPKVKASFKKQYGKRWKEVMYGHSWNLAKQEKKVGLDEETLDEAVSAKRMRIIRKYVKGNKRVPEHLKDYMERSFKKKRAKDAKLSDGRGAVGALETRMRRKSAALRARGIEPKGVAPGYLEEEWGGGFQSSQDAQREVQAGLRRDAAMERKTKIADIKAVLAGRMSKNAFTKKHRTKFSEHPLTKKIVAAREKAKARRLAESMQLDEAGYKKLMRVKGAAYKAELASRGADPNTSLEGLVKTAKLKRAAAEQTAKIAAGMARRGGASPDAVRGGGSRIGKSGKYTQKAGALANQRDKALAKFRARVGYNKAQGMSRSSTEKQISRNTQQFVDDLRNRSRSGDFGQDNQAALRARSKYQKTFGRLKGK